jgi:hypothetical protein
MKKVYIYIDNETKEIICIKTDKPLILKEIVLDIPEMNGIIIDEKIKELLKEESV